jgi:hypothetical protein
MTKMILRRPQRLRARITPIVIVGLLAVLGLSTAAAYSASHLLSAPAPHLAPGVRNDVGSMRTLSPVVDVPAAVLSAVRDSASRSGGDPGDAAQSLRLLVTGAGVTGDQLYAFKGYQGEVCFILWRRMGTCPQGAQTFDQGIVWAVAGSYPAIVGNRELNVPSAVVGIVADNIASVTLAQGSTSTTLPIVRNAFFYELADVADGTPWDARLLVGYTDGSQKTIALPDPRP